MGRSLSHVRNVVRHSKYPRVALVSGGIVQKNAKQTQYEASQIPKELSLIKGDLKERTTPISKEMMLVMVAFTGGFIEIFQNRVFAQGAGSPQQEGELRHITSAVHTKETHKIGSICALSAIGRLMVDTRPL